MKLLLSLVGKNHLLPVSTKEQVAEKDRLITPRLV